MIFGGIASKGDSTNVETGVVEQQNHIIKLLCIKGAVGLPTEGLKRRTMFAPTKVLPF